MVRVFSWTKYICYLLNFHDSIKYSRYDMVNYSSSVQIMCVRVIACTDDVDSCVFDTVLQ